jgi:hypothetical protein
MPKLLVAIVSALIILATLATPAAAKPFFVQHKPSTLRLESLEAPVIVFGHVENARKIMVNGDHVESITDLVITAVIKNHPILAGKKKIQIQSYLPVQNSMKPRTFLIFADIYKGQLDVYRGIECTPAVVQYVRELLALDAKDRLKQLRHYFNFLDHADVKIARDAFEEFQDTARAELAKFAKTLEPDKLRLWLQDTKKPAAERDLFAFLLGHCGTNMDATLLHALIQKDSPHVLDGHLVGYVLLRPAEGWSYLSKMTKDAKQEFGVRYCGFLAAEYFYTARPDVIAKKKVVDLFDALLDQDDFADLAMHKLREWKDWSLTDHVLSCWKKQSHQKPVIKRAIIYYALQCPQAQAAKFIAAACKTHPDLVVEIEEIAAAEAEYTTPAKQEKP